MKQSRKAKVVFGGIYKKIAAFLKNVFTSQLSRDLDAVFGEMERERRMFTTSSSTVSVGGLHSRAAKIEIQREEDIHGSAGSAGDDIEMAKIVARHARHLLEQMRSGKYGKKHVFKDGDVLTVEKADGGVDVLINDVKALFIPFDRMEDWEPTVRKWFT